MTLATPPYQRRWQALVVLAISLLIISVGNTILNVAYAERIQQDLGASSSELQWIVDGYLLLYAGFSCSPPGRSGTASAPGRALVRRAGDLRRRAHPRHLGERARPS